ncbi:hypothetical protein PGTUg99_002739 [Puccinia graminis f. sp. tritici]|uniref:Uncharacterized protein n=1 Tax=Puccinia graminis f. sp. tritici TaxID=56615 RepID=A0A5B0SC05_PUCGR|nr:hypothetical protein PGTUg99_002739 [Puccinia graminis f. sp. tritici]
MYLIDRKETLPIDEVHLPHRPEGNPSGQPGRGAGSQKIPPEKLKQDAKGL